jgi:hypothetical protein
MITSAVWRAKTPDTAAPPPDSLAAAVRRGLACKMDPRFHVG